MERSYTLTIDHPHPARSPMTRVISGKIEAVRRRAQAALKTTAERFGISPLALSWNLEPIT